MIFATDADRPEIEAFLNAHVEKCMFPLENLTTLGMNGGHPRAVSFWLRRAAGKITDVLTVTDEGIVMPYCPNAPWAEAVAALQGRDLVGIIADRDQARTLQAALGLNDAPATLNEDEPQFLLQLADLTIPDGPGDIVPLTDAPEEVIRFWMRDYQIEALHTPEEEAGNNADQSYEQYVRNQSHVALMDGDTPLAMTGFNAQLPEIVQIGGVYTPPHRRGRGHARRALALHLAQARANGTRRATLFASGPPAIKAYKSIGFEQIGDWTLLLFKTPQKVTHG